MTAITNAQAEAFGGVRDDSLKADTVVGYRVQAGFDNGNKIAREVTYNVVDAASKETVATHVEAVGEDGAVPQWTFFFGKGEARGVTRGHDYRFTYTMDIDLKGEGDIETYPACVKPADPNYELTSPTMQAPYQLAELSMYLERRDKTPSGSTETAEWRWVADDPDGVLDQDRKKETRAVFRYKAGKNAIKEVPLVMDGAEPWHALSVQLAPDASYTLQLRQNPYADDPGHGDARWAVDVDVLTHYVEARRSWSLTGDKAAFRSITAGYESDDKARGMFTVRLTPTDSLTLADLNAVAALELTMSAQDGSASKTITVAPEVVATDTGGTLEAKIALKDIQELLGTTFTVKAKVIYDTGDFGVADATDADSLMKGNAMFAYQQLVGEGGTAASAQPGAYLGVAAGSSYAYASAESLAGMGAKLTADMGALDASSAFTGTRGNAVDMQFRLLGATSGSKAKIRSHAGGMMLVDGGDKPTGQTVAVKRLAYAKGEAEATGSVVFDAIPPIIQVESIKAGVDRAEVTFTPELVGMTADKGAVTVELLRKKKGPGAYEATGESYTYEGTFVHNKKATITVPQGVEDDPAKGLDPEYQYAIRFSVSVRPTNKPNAKPVVTEVVDKEIGAPKHYELNLIDNVDVAVQDMLIVPSEDDPYGAKTLEVRYQLSDKITNVAAEAAVFAADPDGAPTGEALLVQSIDNNADRGTFSFDYAPGSENARKVTLPGRYVVQVSLRTLDKGDGSARFLLGQGELAVSLKQLAKPTTSITARPEFEDATDAEAQRRANEAARAAEEERARRVASETLDGDEAAREPEDAAADAGGAAAERHYNLTFNVSVFDLDGSLVGGKYKVRFFCDGEQVKGDEYTEVYDIKDKNKSFELRDLEPGTVYTIKVYGVLDRKNEGGKGDIGTVDKLTGEYVIASSEGRTTPTTGVEVGNVQLTQRPGHPNQFEMNFYGSVNLTSIHEVQYTTYSPSAVVKTGTMPFTVKSNSLGYTFTPEIELPAPGYYTTQMTYLDEDGEILATGTYEYVYIDAGQEG